MVYASKQAMAGGRVKSLRRFGRELYHFSSHGNIYVRGRIHRTELGRFRDSLRSILNRSVRMVA